MTCVKLSAKCEKAALQDPQGCRKAAYTAADKDCAGITGQGRGNCMDARFNYWLAQKCGKIVCPNDPFMCEESGQDTYTKTTTYRADEGGGFSSNVAELSMQQEFSTAAQSEGGIDPSKMRTYVLGGLVVLVVLAVAAGSKK